MELLSPVVALMPLAMAPGAMHPSHPVMTEMIKLERNHVPSVVHFPWAPPRSDKSWYHRTRGLVWPGGGGGRGSAWLDFRPPRASSERENGLPQRGGVTPSAVFSVVRGWQGEWKVTYGREASRASSEGAAAPRNTFNDE